MKIVIDTETTGLEPTAGDEILQISIVDADTKRVLFDEYIKPQSVTEWTAASAVNHITPEMVEDRPTIDQYRAEIQRIFEDATEIIGYNTHFDLKFLAVNGKIYPNRSAKIIDCMQEYSECYGRWDAKRNNWKWLKLIEAAERFGFDWDEYPAHNSLGDVYATLAVYNAMRDKNLYYIAQAFYADGTNCRGIAEYIGHAKRQLYQMEQRRDDVERSQIIAIDQDGTPHIVVQHPPF